MGWGENELRQYERAQRRARLAFVMLAVVGIAMLGLAVIWGRVRAP
jgi:hypothetical protein